MHFLDKLERKMGKCYIPDLMKWLCLAMLGVFVLDYLPFRTSAYSLLYFNRELIMQGQVWRLITFIFLPPDSSVLFILITLYFYYMIGTALENQWGSRRFNLYYLIGIIGNIISGFITGYATNMYLNLSLILAFAMLFPDFQLMLFFVLPVKIKWLALADVALLIYELIIGSWAARAGLLFSMLPFFLFFGKPLWQQVRMDMKHLRFWWENRRNKS